MLVTGVSLFVVRLNRDDFTDCPPPPYPDYLFDRSLRVPYDTCVEDIGNRQTAESIAGITLTSAGSVIAIVSGIVLGTTRNAYHTTVASALPRLFVASNRVQLGWSF